METKCIKCKDKWHVDYNIEVSTKQVRHTQHRFVCPECSEKLN